MEISANKRFGKPTIIGTRISVANVLNWLANVMSNQEIIEDLPEVSKDSIKACLMYAASKEDHLGLAS